MELSFEPAIPILGLFPKFPETLIQKNLCTPMFIEAQFTIAKCWKQPKCPLVAQKTMLHLHNGILHSRKKDGIPTLCNSVEGSREHYAKWNKPGGERQMPYDLTRKWNLINKTNKQAKYNHIHGNKEQTVLAGVAQWIECWTRNQKVVGLIPSQGTCLGCMLGPQLGACERQPIEYLSHIDVFLP